MALALAKEKLNYSAEQLNAFTTKIRSGDLTPILEIYEEDIKRPVKSAVTGTLLRSVFVQVQKAKVSTSNRGQFQSLGLHSLCVPGRHRSSSRRNRQAPEITRTYVRIRRRRPRTRHSLHHRRISRFLLQQQAIRPQRSFRRKTQTYCSLARHASHRTAPHLPTTRSPFRRFALTIPHPNPKYGETAPDPSTYVWPVVAEFVEPKELCGDLLAVAFEVEGRIFRGYRRFGESVIG